MSHSVVIEITIPVAGESFREHAEAMVGINKPLDEFMAKLSKDAHSSVRIVRARTNAGQPRRKPPAMAAE